MKLRVIIHRQRDFEPSPGTLKAWVQQGTKRGDNLLRGIFRRVDSAIQECDGRLMAEYKLIDPPEIEYVIDECKEATTQGSPANHPPKA
jgi:hypothetical protein